MIVSYRGGGSGGTQQRGVIRGLRIGVACLFAGKDAHSAAEVFVASAGGDFTVAQHKLAGDCVFEEKVAP
jgi:hypothetical protein